MSKPDSLSKYLTSFLRLKQSGTFIDKAPDKPVLLISIIELIEKGNLKSNRILINPEIESVFQKNKQLLSGKSLRADLSTPLYHLQDDKAGGKQFWFVQANELKKPGKPTDPLSRIIEFCYFAEDLFMLLMDPVTRKILRTYLLNTYFPKTRLKYAAVNV